MFETIKTIGSFAGLATLAFTIWDRWVRGRPLAWLTATKRFGILAEYICIINPGRSDLFIREVSVYPRTARVLYGVAKDHSEKAVLSTLYSTDVNALLRSGDEKYLPIIRLPKLLDAPPKDAPRGSAS